MCGRSLGANCQHSRIMVRSVGSTSGGRCESSVSPPNTLAPTLMSPIPSHGSLPRVTISYRSWWATTHGVKGGLRPKKGVASPPQLRTTPKDHTSDAVEYCRWRRLSGAIQRTGPTLLDVTPTSTGSLSTRANLQSHGGGREWWHTGGSHNTTWRRTQNPPRAGCSAHPRARFEPPGPCGRRFPCADETHQPQLVQPWTPASCGLSW